MPALSLLSNIDCVTMVTDFREFKQKICYIKAFIRNIFTYKSLHKLKSFKFWTIKWRYLNFIATKLCCQGNKS